MLAKAVCQLIHELTDTPLSRASRIVAPPLPQGKASPRGEGMVGLVRVPRHLGAPAADQEVEVAALVRLQHMVDVQLAITAHQ